jgi:hypothetical protein
MQKNIYPKSYRLEQGRGNLSMLLSDHGQFDLARLPNVSAELRLAAVRLRHQLVAAGWACALMQPLRQVCRVRTQLTCKKGNTCLRAECCC